MISIAIPGDQISPKVSDLAPLRTDRIQVTGPRVSSFQDHKCKCSKTLQNRMDAVYSMIVVIVQRAARRVLFLVPAWRDFINNSLKSRVVQSSPIVWGV